MSENIFLQSVSRILDESSVRKLVEDHSAVVLERIARGGGTTRWYYCRHPADIAVLARSFSPGSVVSFYFDDRISVEQAGESTLSKLLDTVRTTGECIAGVIRTNSIEVLVEIISGPTELIEFFRSLPTGAHLLHGEFPERANDGVRAVTIALPDADGVLRPNPH